jgi:hypothetical protein
MQNQAIISMPAMLGDEKTLDDFVVDVIVIMVEAGTLEGLEEGIFIAITPIIMLNQCLFYSCLRKSFRVQSLMWIFSF